VSLKRHPDTNRVLPGIRAKKETGRVGPVSEAPVAMRLHRTARLVQRIADVVHVRLFISRQQSVQKERVMVKVWFDPPKLLYGTVI
jgi:hypothetical protein